MLGWGQQDLASASGLSLSTVRKLEEGIVSGRGDTYGAIRRVVEENGLEFTEREGIRTRPRGIVVLEGPDASQQYFDHVLKAVEQFGGEILAICPTFPMLMGCLGGTAERLDPIKRLSGFAAIKCLLWDGQEAPSLVEAIQFRAVSRLQAWPTPYFVYGDRLCFSVCDGGSTVRFIVIQSLIHARHWGNHFLKLWDAAAPFLKRATETHKRSPASAERTTRDIELVGKGRKQR